VSKGEVREIGYFDLTNKYATTRENMKEWIEIIRGRPREKVKVDLRIATINPRENLKRWVIRSLSTCAFRAAHNKNTAIR
jgi:hypothetical protein